jgi:TonB-dependent receptor
MPLRIFFLQTILLLYCCTAFAQTAAIKGNVFDAVTRDGLPGSDISIPNTNFHKIADTKGNFEFLQIPAGEYDLTISIIGYTTIHRHITLKEGKTLQLFLGLTQEGKSLEEVTVFGRADREKETGSRDRERTAVNMLNVISSQAMVRSPDINAANVLQRMSGVTIQRNSGGDEAYAVIRGMEPRYSNTLLNGTKIASPDSKNRYVSLSIIPSDILSSIEISKSLTPDMEGDATGGTVNLVVKDAPDKTSFKATASVGYSQLFFDEKFIDFKKKDIQSQSPVMRNPPGYVAQPGDFSRSNLDFQPRQAPPTGLIGFSWTHRYFHDKLGVVVADNLQNQYYGTIGFSAVVTPGADTTGKLEASDANNYKEYTQQLNNGLVTHLDYVINEKNKVSIDNFFLYSYLALARINQDTTLIGTGRVGPGTGQVFTSSQSNTQNQYVENLRVAGQHVLSSSLKLDWAGIYSQAGNRQPDIATISNVFLINGNHVPSAVFFDGISRTWQRNDDKGYTGVLDLDYNKKIHGNSLQVKLGGLYRNQSRYNTQDDYNLVPPTTNSSGGAASKPAWDNIYDASWVVFNSAGTSSYNPNNYHATEEIYDAYGLLRYRTNIWEVGGGLRVEHTNDNWNIRVHSPTQPSFGNQTYQDFLPSAYLKFHLSQHENLHAAYYKSIARPNYYELVPAQTQSPGSNTIVTGNPYVNHSVADNYDLRYELFGKGEQHFFAGAFYKRIQNPIELGIGGNTSTGRFNEIPSNSNTANNLGLEASFTYYWGRFGVTGNYTYTHSTISSDQLTYQGTHVHPTRAMQGQTDHIGNLSLLYKDVKHGTFAQLAYEYQGNTLAATGLFAGSDYIQHPTNTLAFSAEKDIHKHFTLFGKFNNLLNTATKQYVQNTILVVNNTTRATYVIGIRYQ